MLIRCEQCGKLFDYMKNDGICPECGRYHSIPEGAEPEAPELLSEEEYIQGEGGVSGRPAAQLRNQSRRRLTFSLLVLWALILAVGFAWFHVRQAKRQNEGWYTVTVEPTVVDSVFFFRDQQVEVSPVQRMGREYQGGVPAGHQLIRIPMTPIERHYSEDPSDRVYLRVEIGGRTEYLDPVYNFELAELYPDLDHGLISDELLCYSEDGQGWLYFSVPDGFDSLTLYLEQARQEEYEEPRQIEAVYLCPLTMAEETIPEGEVNIDA